MTVGWTRQAQLAEIFRIQRETQPHLRRRVRSCCRSRPCRHACSGSWWPQLSWRLQRNVILRVLRLLRSPRITINIGAMIVLVSPARDDTDPMTGVEGDAGGHVYEPSANCERGGTNARALVLGPILVVPRAWLRQGQ